MDTYTVTYRPTEHTRESVTDLPDTDMSLEDVRAICQSVHTNAALYSDNGEYRGWVHADGTYQLQ